MDIGKPRDYLKANRILLDAKAKKGLLRNDVNMDEGVKFNNPVMVDEGVRKTLKNLVENKNDNI